MNKGISVVIIEDEKESLEFLSKTLVENFKEIEIVGNSDNIQDSIKLLKQQNPELVFMDIELIDGNSFQILDEIKNYEFEIIFTTAHNNYIEKAMEYYAFNFLSKPIDVSKLKNIVQRYINLKDRVFTKQKYDLLKGFLTESRLLIHTGNEHIAVDIDNIIKCEADGNYTYFVTTNKSKYLASKSLKHYESLLISKGFFRANRSTLINIKHIASIYKKEAIILTNKEKIIVSVRNKSKLSDLINLFS
ncbi:LytR/AlgR family response regulator transcription factor [Aquimarina sp. 2201CG14-23]|uniref:LytR/AlgR family response regulator transcription factor n=1 Tax=Aquimarina mycalae TaxID=3040073 RepID=UPI0024781B53|nr:LytTR family DNA-binding domain-containing protein [Aquimarina sp. 2201CG14-23]MDH7446925.1 LytTR family DNA-binding domain-containing protein [Aquimarina sp. 2201CG14-23]